MGVTCAMQPCRLEDENEDVRRATVEALGKLESGELAKHAEAIAARCDASCRGWGNRRGTIGQMGMRHVHAIV